MDNKWLFNLDHDLLDAGFKLRPKMLDRTYSDESIRVVIYDSVVYMDREDCFNKLQQSPVRLLLPTSQDNIDFIFSLIPWLNSEDGYEVSNEFQSDKYIWEYKSIYER